MIKEGFYRVCDLGNDCLFIEWCFLILNVRKNNSSVEVGEEGCIFGRKKVFLIYF